MKEKEDEGKWRGNMYLAMLPKEFIVYMLYQGARNISNQWSNLSSKDSRRRKANIPNTNQRK